MGERPERWLQNEAWLWFLLSSSHSPGTSRPRLLVQAPRRWGGSGGKGELGPVCQGVLEAIGDAGWSLVSLMNGVRLPSWQGTHSGAAVDQTQHALTHPVFLWMSLPFRGGFWHFPVLVVLARMIQKDFFLPRQTVSQMLRVTGAGCGLRNLGQRPV